LTGQLARVVSVLVVESVDVSAVVLALDQLIRPSP